jgi:uncharacterized protein involved in outer membrane biogenesis
MSRSSLRKAKWVAGAFAGVVAALVLFSIFFDWNSMRGPLARLISAKTGATATISGDLHVHLWSWNPSLSVAGLRLDDPSSPAHGDLFAARRILVQISVARLLIGQIVLPRVELDAPHLNLERDAAGHANWQAHAVQPAPAKPGAPLHLPVVRQLAIEDGRIHVVDQVRKLVFDGDVTAHEGASSAAGSGFRLQSTGRINGRSFEMTTNGGPLLDVDPGKPYRFTTHLVAGDLRLDAESSIAKPFDLAAYTAQFKLSGSDLANAYYVTDLALPNTGHYEISGHLQHVGNEFVIADLAGRIGSSDLEGTLRVTVGGVRPKLVAQLHAKRFVLADLAPTLGAGAPSALSSDAAASSRPAASSQASTSPITAATASALTPAAAPAPPAVAAAPAPAAAPAGGLLLPDADLQLARVRGMDADVHFVADSLVAPNLPLENLRFHLTLEAGVLELDPLSFALAQGQFAGAVRIDASTSPPDTHIDMKLQNLQLADFKPASAEQAPMTGTLVGRVQLHGLGSSVHKFASDADGTISFVVPNGQVRAAFAELLGIDVARGLGLLLSQDQQRTELRCGVAEFTAQDGAVDANTIVFDTTNVIVTGRGHLNLGSERLDLSLEGDPKKPRLIRLRSPITLTGNFVKPRIGIEPQKALVQAAAATALGVLLTPVAAILAFVDPGLAKNADCSALLAQAQTKIARAGPESMRAADGP